MPTQFTVTTDDPIIAQRLAAAFAGVSASPVAAPSSPAPAAAEPAKAETKAPAEKKAAAKKEEKAEAPKQTFTLQQCIDRAMEIVGDGTDGEILTKIGDINTKLGIKKVRELPADKLDTYMAELDKEWPKAAAAATPNAADMF